MAGIVTFECRVLAGFTELEWVVLDDEAAAVEWAQARLSPLVTQVTIEACAGDVSTFGIRHLHPDGTDSGWSCWLDGDKVNTRSLDVLFAEPPPAAPIAAVRSLVARPGLGQRDPADTFSDEFYACTSCNWEEPNLAGLKRHTLAEHGRPANDTERQAVAS